MAAELGELVLTMEADDLRLKKQLKGAEKLTKKSADSMAKSLGKVKASSVDASEGFSILEKAAAATGLTWLSQVKSMGELGLALLRIKTGLGLSSTAYTVETVAIGKNTAAMAANTTARVAQRVAITAMSEPWEGLARAKAGPMGRRRGVRADRVTIGTTAAMIAAEIGVIEAIWKRSAIMKWIGQAAQAGKLTAYGVAATGLATVIKLSWDLWKVHKKDKEVREKSLELEKQLSLRMQAARDTAEKQMSTLQRRLQVARGGLTGAAAHEVMQRDTKPDAILDMELQVMRVQESQAYHARKLQEIATYRERQLQEQLATEERITAEKKHQAELTRQQNIAAKASRIMAGVASPSEMIAEAERLMKQTAEQVMYQSRVIEVLRGIGGDLAQLTLAHLGWAPKLAEEKAGIGGRGMLVSAREVAGMPVPRLGRGGAGGIGPQSTERKSLRAQEQTAKNTRRIADAVQQGTGMAS